MSVEFLPDGITHNTAAALKINQIEDEDAISNVRNAVERFTEIRHKYPFVF